MNHSLTLTSAETFSLPSTVTLVSNPLHTKVQQEKLILLMPNYQVTKHFHIMIFESEHFPTNSRKQLIVLYLSHPL
ncbi:hypothetical protein GBAR_LOCUS24555, partial [Geodia barretti]